MAHATDSLINELFPNMNGDQKMRSSFDEDDSPKKGQTSAPRTNATAPLKANFDSDDDTSPANNQAVTTKKPAKPSTGNTFDDSSDDEESSDGDQATRHVPFPSIPPNVTSTAACDTCVLSNVPNTELHERYNYLRQQQLQTVAGLMPNIDVVPRDPELNAGVSLKMSSHLAKKYPFAAYISAFHATHPQGGNGVDEKSGSPFVFCLKCDHVVTRLQDAAWADAVDVATGNANTNNPPCATDTDLYLSVRYFYPDWSRFLTQPIQQGTSPATPAMNAPPSQAIARTMAPSASGQRWAAYGCQCSWVTVGVPEFKFSTSMLDVARARKSESQFVTSITPQNAAALESGSTTDGARLPLWVSKGAVS